MASEKEKTTSDKEISVFNSSDGFYPNVRALYSSAWGAMELGEKLVELIKKGEQSPEVKLTLLLAKDANPIVITEVERLCAKTALQESIAGVLIKLSAEHNKRVCVAGKNLEEITPILLERILNYNKSVKMAEKKLDNENVLIEQKHFIGEYSIKPDKYRRITLPKALFSDISNTDELVLVGVGNHCELWKKDDWERTLDEIASEEIDDILDFLKGNVEEE